MYIQSYRIILHKIFILQTQLDFVNYYYVKLMKQGTLKLKPGKIPHLFECQKDWTFIPSQTQQTSNQDERVQRTQKGTVPTIYIFNWFNLLQLLYSYTWDITMYE